MKTLFLLPLSFLTTVQICYSQNFAPDLAISVTKNGITLNNAWAGGLDNPQFSVIDLDGDGTKDLFVFEPDYNRITTYINNGTLNQVDYHYAPEYIQAFPKMHNWVRLVDYNCDGKEDIFTYDYTGGTRVYTNTTTTGLQFTLKDSLLYTYYTGGVYANLFIEPNVLVSITDVDNDGDIDILVPQLAGFGLEFHKNYSMENYGICDSLEFILDTTPWGGINFRNGTNESYSYLAFDNDADGDMDMLSNTTDQWSNTGQLYYFENTGTFATANLVLADDSFPSYNTPAITRNYQGAFYFDADNDGRKDLVTTPIFISPDKNAFNVCLYKDTSTTSLNKFTLATDNFLGQEMIEVGSWANVRFFDVDNDGLRDMIIGNRQKRTLNPVDDASSLSFYKNTGTLSNPSFEFVTDNFENSVSQSAAGMAPAFGDLTGDGNADMLVGLLDGTLQFYASTAGNFALTSNNYQGIDVGHNNAPFLFDVNQDGLIDLICGDVSGQLSYFENTGTSSSPVFNLMSSFWGGVNVTDLQWQSWGNSYPFMHMNNGGLELLVGSRRGNIFRYGNISGNLGGTFTLLDSTYGDIYEPSGLTVDGFDINGDGIMDVITGNFAGGVTIYKQLPVSVNDVSTEKIDLTIFPNPSQKTITVKSGIRATGYVVSSVDGKKIRSRKIKTSNSFEVNVSGLAKGTYVITIVTEKKQFSREFVKN